MISFLITGLAVYLAAMFIPGVEVKNFLHALIVAVVLALLNTFVEPVLLFFAIPAQILTLGLFTFVIDGIIIMLAGMILPGFKVDGCFTAIIYSIALSILNSVLLSFL